MKSFDYADDGSHGAETAYGYMPDTGIKTLEQTLSDLIPLPATSGRVLVNEAVERALPVKGTKVLDASRYGVSLWGQTFKIVTRLPSGITINYFLKGKYHKADTTSDTSSDAYFLLSEFRLINQQPAYPVELGARLADMHQKSISPTGKFGFHIATCHAKIAQAVTTWEDSWCVLFSKHIGHIMDLAKPILNWSQFDVVCKLTLEKVVPRLLLPLQSEGRVLKPSLIHGDCWDGNTAMDMKTGEAFVFDACCFYGHNEYDIGNWRAPRHKLSDSAYIDNYHKHFPISEPVEDWDARNLLYSLPFNIGNTIYVPGSDQRQVVYDDMTTLCRMFCPEDLEQEMSVLNKTSTGYLMNPGVDGGNENEEEKEKGEKEAGRGRKRKRTDG